MNQRILIGSSYFAGGKGGQAFREELSRHWMNQIAKIDIQPTRIVVVCEAGSELKHVGPNFDVVKLSGDLGHCGQLLNGSKKNEFSGWSASMLAGAMLAYTDEADFLYVEQDALMFGKMVEQCYLDMGDACMVFGHKHPSEPWQPCSQSVFLVRHSFLPTFVSTFLRLGSDRNVRSLGERKFVDIENRFGHSLVRRLSVGIDRCRPIPWDEPTWYCQQWSPDEIEEAKRRGLL